MAAKSLISVVLSELRFLGFLSLAATLCGETWHLSFVQDGPCCSFCVDSKAGFPVCSLEDRQASFVDSSGFLDKACKVLDVKPLSFCAPWLKMLSEKHATKNIFLGSVT